jgi:hypothetical protein
MSNAFGFVLDDASLRRAAVEGVPETVIAAIYLLHERSVGEVGAKLTPDELEHVIRLVGRCPSCYPLGTLDAFKSMRTASLTPTAGSLLPSAQEGAAAHPHMRPSPRPEVTRGTAERGCVADHIVQIDAAERLSEFLLSGAQNREHDCDDQLRVRLFFGWVDHSGGEVYRLPLYRCARARAHNRRADRGCP